MGLRYEVSTAPVPTDLGLTEGPFIVDTKLNVVAPMMSVAGAKRVAVELNGGARDHEDVFWLEPR